MLSQYIVLEIEPSRLYKIAIASHRCDNVLMYMPLADSYYVTKDDAGQLYEKREARTNQFATYEDAKKAINEIEMRWQDGMPITRGHCSICHNDACETKHLSLYAVGSEGIYVCHECEMRLVEFVRNMRSLASNATLRGVKLGKRER